MLVSTLMLSRTTVRNFSGAIGKPNEVLRRSYNLFQFIGNKGFYSIPSEKIADPIKSLTIGPGGHAKALQDACQQDQPPAVVQHVTGDICPSWQEDPAVRRPWQLRRWQHPHRHHPSVRHISYRRALLIVHVSSLSPDTTLSGAHPALRGAPGKTHSRCD
jgi:hypothetical protein